MPAIKGKSDCILLSSYLFTKRTDNYNYTTRSPNQTPKNSNLREAINCAIDICGSQLCDMVLSVRKHNCAIQHPYSNWEHSGAVLLSVIIFGVKIMNTQSFSAFMVIDSVYSGALGWLLLSFAVKLIMSSIPGPVAYKVITYSKQV